MARQTRMTTFATSSTPSTDGAMTRARSIVGASEWAMSQAPTRTAIVGTPNRSAGRNRPFRSWPEPGRTEEAIAARSRRRSVRPRPTGRRSTSRPSGSRRRSVGSASTALRLVESTPMGKGTVLGIYQPVGKPSYGEFQMEEGFGLPDT